MNHLIDADDKKVADPELCASTSFVLIEGEELSTLPRTECARHEVSSSKGRREQATQLKFLETLIDKLIKGRKHPTGVPPSSGMTNSCLKIHFLTMKKMKNSHPHIPHVPHVPHVRPVSQQPQAPDLHSRSPWDDGDPPTGPLQACRASGRLGYHPTASARMIKSAREQEGFKDSTRPPESSTPRTLPVTLTDLGLFLYPNIVFFHQSLKV